MLVFDDADRCAQMIIEQKGKRLVVATPLGLGKPVQLLNALYRRAEQDPSIELCILTALSFLRPKPAKGLSSRLLTPYFDRVFGDYEDLLYEQRRRARALPKNIRVIEFFLSAGAYLQNGNAQRDVVSCNFTHVVRDMVAMGINVIALMMAQDNSEPDRLSLSCNTDVTPQLIDGAKGALLAGQINDNLPYMYGPAAQIQKDRFDLILDCKDGHRSLFAIPKQPLNQQEYMIGLYVSSLIVDDGCLQMGIGNLCDAIVYALILRHTQNPSYKKLLSSTKANFDNQEPFLAGLFAPTEMLVDGYLKLYQNGILKKKVMDDRGTPHVAHAGFFVGSNEFYRALAHMPLKERRLFSMRSIFEINQLYGDEEKRRSERVNARFVNSCMRATLLGEVISDTLSNGLTISGVGGQYNFVAMAHELEGARSIIMCKSTRRDKHGLRSNMVWNDGPATIPRHLRDIVVSEYGIADLRGKTDEEVIKAMLNITDSRFQNALLKTAKAVKKIPSNYQIPYIHRNNTPRQISDHFKGCENIFPRFPLGSEFDETEKALAEILVSVKEQNSIGRVKGIAKGLLRTPSSDEQDLLKRMDLAQPTSLKDKLDRALLLGSMN